MNIDNIDVTQLSPNALYITPVPYDWSENKSDCPEWEIIYPSTNTWSLTACKDYLDRVGVTPPAPNPWTMNNLSLMMYLEDFLGMNFSFENREALIEMLVDLLDSREVDGLRIWRNVCEQNIFQRENLIPAVWYFYPLPHFDLSETSSAQMNLLEAGLPLVLVMVGQQPVLALKAGGMDLSWEICQGYMCLGYLPPIHFLCGLPNLAGHVNATVIAAAERTLDLVTSTLHQTWREIELLKRKQQMKAVHTTL